MVIQLESGVCVSSLKHASRVTVAALAFLTFGCSGSKSAGPGGTQTTAGSTDSIAAGNAYDPGTDPALMPCLDARERPVYRWRYRRTATIERAVFDRDTPLK